MTDTTDEPHPLPQDENDPELQRLVEQLKLDEVNAEDARLSSVESFQEWLKTRPALMYTGVVDMLNQYGPAFLEIIKRLVGA
jgi:hypothetical protein